MTISGDDCPKQTPITSIKLGWQEGVLMPCLLNIWGVMLFLRLTWVIGQAGIVQGLLLMTIANVVTFLTALSMSAVCTNGQIKGGGVYYMISRSLGPEFGGAIGLMFTFANSIAVAMYVIGFCESLLDMLTEVYGGEFEGIVDAGVNDVRIIGCGTLFILLIIAIVGMEWITRVQAVLLVLLICSQECQQEINKDYYPNFYSRLILSSDHSCPGVWRSRLKASPAGVTTRSVKTSGPTTRTRHSGQSSLSSSPR